MLEPIWLIHARTFIGQKEIVGIKSNPWIVSLWDKAKWLWSTNPDDSKLPWCGAFVAHCLRLCDLTPPVHWYRASAYNDYGRILETPILGCVGVMTRSGGGHVGFVVGTDKQGNIIMIGGNQGDSVSYSAFPLSRFTAFVWPKATHLPLYTPLPILSATISKSER